MVPHEREEENGEESGRKEHMKVNIL